MVFAVLTVVALIALEFLVLRKRRRPAGEPALRLPGLEPLSRAIRLVPGGVFLQPTFTWARIREDGELVVGVHPLLLGVVGAPYEIERLAEGEEVQKGDPLVRIGRGRRRLVVRSPVAGRITAVNRVVEGETDWRAVEGKNGSWLYRLVPQHVAHEVPNWMIADRAVEWTRHAYERIRTSLVHVTGIGAVGPAMADGGDIPVGVLESLDDAAWQQFQSDVLDR